MRELFLFHTTHQMHGAGFRGPASRHPQLPDARAAVMQDLSWEHELHRHRGSRYDRVTICDGVRVSEHMAQYINAYLLKPGAVILEL